MENIKAIQEMIDREFARSPADSQTLFERLRDLTQRGISKPATLNLKDIQQVCFALSVCLAEEKK